PGSSSCLTALTAYSNLTPTRAQLAAEDAKRIECVNSRRLSVSSTFTPSAQQMQGRPVSRARHVEANAVDGGVRTGCDSIGTSGPSGVHSPVQGRAGIRC